jgi:putative membrane protein
MLSRYHSLLQPGTNKDILALDRTILANERTFLAYVRTAMTLLIGGVSFISFFNQQLIIFLGWIALMPAIFLFWKGASNYYLLKKSLEIN